MAITMMTPDASGSCCGCTDACAGCNCETTTGTIGPAVTSGFSPKATCASIAGGAGRVTVLVADYVNTTWGLPFVSSGIWQSATVNVSQTIGGWCGESCSGSSDFTDRTSATLSVACDSETEITVTLTVVYTWDDGAVEGSITPSCLDGAATSTDVYTATMAWPTSGSSSSGTLSLASGPGLLNPGSVTVSL